MYTWITQTSLVGGKSNLMGHPNVNAMFSVTYNHSLIYSVIFLQLSDERLKWGKKRENE